MRKLVFILLMLFSVISFSQKGYSTSRWILVKNWTKAVVPNPNTEIHYRCWKWDAPDGYGKYTFLFEFQSGSVYNGYYRNTGFSDLTFYYDRKFHYQIQHGIIGTESVYQVYIYSYDRYAHKNLTWSMKNTWIN